MRGSTQEPRKVKALHDQHAENPAFVRKPQEVEGDPTQAQQQRDHSSADRCASSHEHERNEIRPLIEVTWRSDRDQAIHRKTVRQIRPHGERLHKGECSGGDQNEDRPYY